MTTAEDADLDKTARIPIIGQITARQLIVAANRLRDGYSGCEWHLLCWSATSSRAKLLAPHLKSPLFRRF
jgi:hypothetical protein